MRLGTILLAALVVAVLATPSMAMVLGLDYGVGASPAHVRLDGHSHTVWAGKMESYLGGTLGNPLPPNDGTFSGYVFCVDLEHFISLPTEYEVDLLSTSALSNGGRAAWLYNSFVNSVNTNLAAASLQLALWDVVYDDGDGLNVGSFRYLGGLNAAATAQAAAFIAASVGQTSAAGLYKPTGDYGQAMITTPPIPEPGTLALLGVGLGLSFLGFAARRRS